MVEGFDYLLIEKRERFAKTIAPKRIDIEEKKKDDEWKEIFKEQIEEIEEADNIEDIPFSGSFSQGREFKPYEVYAEAIEEKIDSTYDFMKMTKNFIDFMEDSDK